MKTYIARLMAIAVLVASGSACLRAQTGTHTVSFGYDADGNRTSRTIDLVKDNDLRDPSSDPSSDPSEMARYTDIIEECEVDIYPNPASERVFVGMASAPDGMTFTATLFSPLGVPICRKEIETIPAEFDMGGMAAGTYVLELRCGDETRTWKIIKR